MLVETRQSVLGYHIPQGKAPHSLPSTDKNCLKKPPAADLLLISPIAPGAFLKFTKRAQVRNAQAAATVTIGRPRHACGPQPWWMYKLSGRSSLISCGSGNFEGSWPAVTNDVKIVSPSLTTSVLSPSWMTSLVASTTRRTPKAGVERRRLRRSENLIKVPILLTIVTQTRGNKPF